MKTRRCPTQVQVESDSIWNLAGTGVEFGASPPPESRARRRLEKGGAPVPAMGPFDLDRTAYLVVVDGPAAASTFRLVQWAEVVVGRAEDADIVIADPSVSRRHAILTISGEAVTIADLGSRNGTFVGLDRLLAPRKLAHGDTISVGETVLMLTLGNT